MSCACAISSGLWVRPSRRISRHLRYLYNSGLVRDRREGLWMHYRISPGLKPEQAVVLAALSEAVGEGKRKNCVARWHCGSLARHRSGPLRGWQMRPAAKLWAPR